MNVCSRLFGLGLLAGGFLATVQTGEGAPNTAPSTAPAPAAAVMIGDAIAGKETFSEHCSICHGADAKGFIGPYIAGVNWTAPGLIAIVREGVGGYGSMPSFNAEVVTDENVTNVAAYLASLPPAVASKSSAAPVANAAAPASSSKTASTAAAGASQPAASASGAGASAAAPATSGTGDPVHGHQIFSANCAACHGANAQGGVGPSLHGEKSRKDTAAAIAWIKNPKLPMPKLYPSPLSEKDVEDVAAYVESL
jgi:mono/diheme cytochrome c family protein